MTRPPQTIKAQLRAGLAPYARALNLTGPYRGNLDGCNGREVFGWVVRSRDNRGGLSVGLFVGDGLVATTLASGFRADVEEAGIGDGKAGFTFTLTPEILEAGARADGAASVRVLDAPAHLLGTLTLPRASETWLSPGNPLLEACRSLLAGDIAALRKLSVRLDATPGVGSTPPLGAHGLLFSTERLIPGDQTPEGERLPAYLDYVRHRARQDRRFDTEASAEDREHYLDFYLRSYGGHRGRMRVPLSKDIIAHLNQPIVMGGQKHSLPRYVWWRLLDTPAMRDTLRLDSQDGYDRVAFWWAWEEAGALHVEDCLVPERMAERLRAVRSERRTEQVPLTVFMEQLRQKTPRYQIFDQAGAEGRSLFTLCLLVMALGRPDILRYLHPQTVARLTAETEGPSAFTRFVAQLAGSGLPALDRARYGALLRLQGYDSARNVFTSITPEGHRLHAATLPAVTEAVTGLAKVDVQLIGPFRKASGLGMATRLSAAILKQTRLSTHFVDFGLDNPASEGFSKVPELGPFRPARINILHLNSESLPLMHAYGPDVLTGAYNIGYFFWELDSPALVHYLGMGLLDEIWVSADYGVRIYGPHAGKPVTNVGMCHEELPVIDRAAARAALNDRFRLAGDEFVVFFAFDSFSFAQRKNPLGVIAAFQKAFADLPGARLVVKTQNRDFIDDPVQQRMWQRIEAAVERDPRLMIMNETLGYDELLRLKAASDCYISLHRSEGWGFGMIEAMNLKLPVVCTAYSGNMDFCSPETAWLVDCTEVTLDREDYIFVRKGQKWAEPDIDHAARQLRAVHDDPVARAAKVEAAFRNVRQNFSARAIGQRYEARLRAILAGLDARGGAGAAE